MVVIVKGKIIVVTPAARKIFILDSTGFSHHSQDLMNFMGLSFKE